MRKIFLLSLIIAAVMLPGCAQMKESFNNVTGVSKEVPPSSRYLDFHDILIPGEMEKVAKESFIINGNGRLVLSGRVDNDSLSQFFITSMNKEGWVSLNQYKYQGAIKLFFKKPEKFATIVISEDPLSTRVEIWEVPQEKI